MIATLNQRSDSHNCCEDAILINHDEFTITGGVFDGCSSGKNSHWASQTLAYLFSQYNDCTEYECAMQVFEKMYELQLMLRLDSSHFLSTCVLFHYNIVSKQLKIRVLGDGYYYINGKEYTVLQDNQPDYLGYCLDGVGINSYLSKYPVSAVFGVQSWKVCSDGIKSIALPQFLSSELDAQAMLLGPIKSTNFLQRQWNILKNAHFTLSDDLSIVSYEPDV